MAKWRDLNGNRKSRPECICELRFIYNHDEFLGTYFYHLFAQQGTAAALNQIERRINFIGPVNDNVQDGMFVQCTQRNV